jgi:hypothetical protein
MNLRWETKGWGFFLRSCPPSSDLLEKVSELWPALSDRSHFLGDLEDLHNVVQWLKVALSDLYVFGLDHSTHPDIHSFSAHI